MCNDATCRDMDGIFDHLTFESMHSEALRLFEARYAAAGMACKRSRLISMTIEFKESIL